MAEQLPLTFDRGLPVPVNALALRRDVCRRLRMFPDAAARFGFQLREHVEEVALLEHVRQAIKEQTRELKRRAQREGRRMKGRATITYACTTEGRRAQRWIERLSERIGAREPGLCV